MSQITENTLVIKERDIPEFNKLIELAKEDFSTRVNNVVKVYEGNKIAIYVFDCNGSPLFLDSTMSNPVSMRPLIKETCYGRQEIHTEILKKNFIRDSRIHAKVLIKRMFEKFPNGANELEKILPLLTYTFEL